MDHLGDSLRLAAAEPPPTGIDLDRLIEGERRSRRRRAWLGAGGAAAMAVVAVVGTVALVAGRGPGSIGYGVGGEPSATAAKPDPGGRPEPLGQCRAVPSPPAIAADAPGAGPTDSPQPSAPAEPQADAVLRLSGAIQRLLSATLPAMSFADAVHPNCAQIQVSPDASPYPYSAIVVAKDAAGVGTIVIGLSRATPASRDDFGPATEPGAGLYPSYEEKADGTLVGWASGGQYDEGLFNRVGVLRTDGTYVTLIAETGKRAGDTNPVRPTPPATVAQLTSIGLDPALTLFP